MVIWAWNDKIILSSFYDGKSILIGIHFHRIKKIYIQQFKQMSSQNLEAL